MSRRCSLRVRLVGVTHPRDHGPLAGPRRDDGCEPGSQPLDIGWVDLILVTSPAAAPCCGAAADQALLGLLRRDPHGFGARHRGDQLRRLGNVLPVRNQGVQVAERLVL
jgi:hypothetical protein